MTENERRFVELELKVWLGKMRREKPCYAHNVALSSWCREIQDTAQDYLYDVVFSGQGGYVLTSEKTSLIAELKQVVSLSKVNGRLHNALFVDMDVEKVKDLAEKLRGQVESVMMEYKSHVERGTGYEQ